MLRVSGTRRSSLHAPVICAVAILRLAAASPAQAQDSVYVRDLGPGQTGRLLRAALARPHVVITSDRALVALDRDTLLRTTVLILGADATVASTVQGDVIVVGGDLFMHPGGYVQGRAIAIGGGAYGSTLALVTGGLFSHRNHTFDVSRTRAGLALDYRLLDSYRPPFLSFPGVRGFRIPRYDRVNGVSLAWGPLLTIDTGRVEIEPTVTWRSDLGAIDPAVVIRAAFGRRTNVELAAGRWTATNDAWIASSITNTISSFFLGKDRRNYYRAERIEARISRLWETRSSTIEPFIGALTEDGMTVGPGIDAVSGPWSVFGRDDREEGILRPNPPVADGRLTSAFAGVAVTWENLGGEEMAITADLFGNAEAALDAPADERFVQTTLEGSVEFPTFGTQSFSFFTHNVITLGDIAPPQRHSWLGGSGTLRTFPLLIFGGDQLFYAESEYSIPIDRVVLPWLGVPVVSLRHMIGSAGIDSLPPLEQNLGLRLRAGFLRADFTIEPVDGDTKFGIGLTLGR